MTDERLNEIESGFREFHYDVPPMVRDWMGQLIAEVRANLDSQKCSCGARMFRDNDELVCPECR